MNSTESKCLSTASTDGGSRRREVPQSLIPTHFPAHDPALIVTGVVRRGDGRGRLLGFPTANIVLDPGTHRHGVWSALVVTADGRRWPAAVSIGRRSTFYGRDGQLLLEAHLLDVEGLDLYGEEISVHLCERIRPQRRFADVDDLKDQLARDVHHSRSWAMSSSAADTR
ncbi:riboflavin kinase [Streptomyces viridiviolaceus]|uniref:riboflavin kinase n=1 Tax=Streptomyces viridiviolaceus TaxID=68282 RepID=A0ABW2E8G6_9ACTN|nr:riboflavin kinase [Streptomyces viridiviolaceus]GHB56710.1 riboflavin kinase [Streptomyces viridiviolaceus]